MRKGGDNMKRMAAHVGIVLLLTACAGGQSRWDWQRTEVQGTEDLLAVRVGPPVLSEDFKLCSEYTREMHGEAVEEGRFRDCMTLRGWYPHTK
jgi:hypothetical protein